MTVSEAKENVSVKARPTQRHLLKLRTNWNRMWAKIRVTV